MKKLQAFLATLLLTATSISGISSSAYSVALDLENLPEDVFVYDNWLCAPSWSGDSINLIGVVDMTVTSIKVPAEINGLPVTGIRDGDSETGYGKNHDLDSCYNLTEILVDEENEYFKTVDGVLFSKNLGEFLAYPHALEKEIYTMPEGTFSITPNGGFHYCNNLKELIFPETLLENQDISIYNCNSLEKVTTSGVLNQLHFGYCPKLNEINLKAPENNSNLFTLMTFTNLGSLETLNIPENYNIGSYLWLINCPSLRELSLPCGMNANSDIIVRSCDSLESLDLSKMQMKKPVYDDDSFITLPDGYADFVIAEMNRPQQDITVADCAELKELRLTDAKSYTITNCPKLTNLSFDTDSYFTLQLQSENSGLQDLYFYSSKHDLEIVDSVYNYPTQDRDYNFLSLADMGVTIHCRRDDKGTQEMCEQYGIPYVILEDEVIPGDTTGDGELDIRDVIMTNRIYVGVEKSKPSRILGGDRDGNGKLDLSDSMQILRKLVGLDD